MNRREFREHWMPLRGNLLIGVSHMVMQDKTQGYEYLRLESRQDGIYYVAAPSGKSEIGIPDDGADRRPGGWPRRRRYSRSPIRRWSFRRRSPIAAGPRGGCMPSYRGKSGGKDREVTYPMRRVDCESGEFIRR